MDTSALLAFLQARDAAYCFHCLAQAFPRSRVQRTLEAARQAGAPVLIGDGRCAICTRLTTVVAWISGDPALARLPV
jgi:hypothetical protein